MHGPVEKPKPETQWGNGAIISEFDVLSVVEYGTNIMPVIGTRSQQAEPGREKRQSHSEKEIDAATRNSWLFLDCQHLVEYNIPSESMQFSCER